MARGDLTDQQSELLEPHLPPRKPKRGRPNADHRRIVNGILWIDRTGASWRYLPDRYDPWRTVASRFYRWQKAEVWHRVLYYRERNVLKVNVLPENVAEAVLHFASEARSSRSTGNILNVDGGVKDAYPR